MKKVLEPPGLRDALHAHSLDFGRFISSHNFQSDVEETIVA